MLEVLEGDCVEAMAAMPAASADAIVTDPPYGLEFMGKDWDRLSDVNRANRGTQPNRQRPPGESGKAAKFQLPAPAFDLSASSHRTMQAWHERWAREALRVLKPGGHLLAFGGTRTYHRLTCALEDAGFEIRDTICWLYGSGFPKSLDVSKAIDKAAGAAREVVERRRTNSGGMESLNTGNAAQGYRENDYSDGENVLDLTVPATPEAEQWDGWGTALKPAHEPIVVARKPLTGTVAANVLEHGTGAINVGACRIAHDEECRMLPDQHGDQEGNFYRQGGRHGETLELKPEGRWPANVVLSHHPDCRPSGTRELRSNGHYPAARGASGYGSNVPDSNGGGLKGQGGLAERHVGLELIDVYDCHPDCPVRRLDEQAGPLRSGEDNVRRESGADRAGNRGAAYGAESRPAGAVMLSYGDAGGASRFFYVAKSSTAERNAGLDEFPLLESGIMEDDSYEWSTDGHGIPRGRKTRSRNTHPTVKPLELMRWLVRLVTPAGGLVLDPFVGSGTTGIAAHLEGLRFVGIEKNADYVPIARARLAHWAQFPVGTASEQVLVASQERAARAGAGQLAWEGL